MSSRKSVRPEQSARDKRVARLIAFIRRSQARNGADGPIGARIDRTIEETKEILRQAKKQFARSKVSTDRSLAAVKKWLAESRVGGRNRKRGSDRNVD